MTNALQATLHDLASDFILGIVRAMRAASVAEIADFSAPAIPVATPPATVAPVRTMRSPRRHDVPAPTQTPRPQGTPEAIRRAKILVEHVRTHPGQSGIEIREALGLKPGPWQTYVGHARDAGWLRTERPSGKALRYWAVSEAATVEAPKARRSTRAASPRTIAEAPAGQDEPTIDAQVVEPPTPSPPKATPETPQPAAPAQSADADLLVAYVRSHPGATGKDIRHALGLTADEWGTQIDHAMTSGRVRRTGKRSSRRNTRRYWPGGGAATLSRER